MSNLTPTYKVVKSGRYVEVFSFFSASNGRKINPSLYVKKKRTYKRYYAFGTDIRLDSLFRSRSKLKRLIRCNAECKKFITLTFGDRITDISQSNKLFNDFIHRMRRRYPNFKYMAVPEYQRDYDYKGEKNARVHYHLLCNIKGFIDNEKIEKIWSHGWTKTKDIKERGMSNYLCKYMTKNVDNRLFGQRRYLFSFNCLRSKVFKNVSLLDINYIHNLLSKYLLFSKEIEFKWGAILHYYQYQVP